MLPGRRRITRGKGCKSIGTDDIGAPIYRYIDGYFNIVSDIGGYLCCLVSGWVNKLWFLWLRVDLIRDLRH